MAGLAELMIRGWWAHITMVNSDIPWPEASSLPGPRNIPGAMFKWCDFLQCNTQGLCCEPSSRKWHVAPFWRQIALMSPVLLGHLPKKQLQPCSFFANCDCFCAGTASCSRDLRSAKPQIFLLYHYRKPKATVALNGDRIGTTPLQPLRELCTRTIGAWGVRVWSLNLEFTNTVAFTPQ